MKTSTTNSFKYKFRAPGSQVEGPIRFAVGQSAVGKVLVGRSQRGICSILLGENTKSLREQLGEAFPGSELRADQAALQDEVDHVVAFIDNDVPDGVIDLDIGGTAFQQKVWKALCDIPIGQTRSYGDVAQVLGAPDAVRAVAGACASNVLAIAIPCHRVVGSDGSLSGYRWGVERKRELIRREARP